MRNTGDVLSSGPDRPDPAAFRWLVSLRPSWPRYRRGRADLARGVLLVLMLTLVVAGLSPLWRSDPGPRLHGWRQELVFGTPYLGLLAVLAGLRRGFAVLAAACAGSLWVLVAALDRADPRDGLGTGASLSAAVLPLALLAALVLIPLSPREFPDYRNLAWPHRSGLVGVAAGLVLVAAALPAARWYHHDLLLDTTTTGAPLPAAHPAPTHPGPVRWTAGRVAGLSRGVLVESRTGGHWQGAVARDARTGATRWKHLRADWQVSQVEVVAGSSAVLVQAVLHGKSTVTLLDLASGRVRWQRVVPARALPVAGGPVLVLRLPADPRPIAYRWDTGRRVWRYDPPGCQVADLVVDTTRVYVESTCPVSGSPRTVLPVVAALDGRGRQSWRTELPTDSRGNIGGHADLRGSAVDFGSEWLDRRTGARVTPFGVPPAFLSASDDGLVVGTSPEAVTAVDAGTGERRWERSGPARRRDPTVPAIVDGRVYVVWTLGDGNSTVALEVLDDRTGTPLGPPRRVTFRCRNRPPHGVCMDSQPQPRVWAGGGIVALEDPARGTLVLT